MAQKVKNPPAKQEIQVQSLDGEDPGWEDPGLGNTPVFLPGKCHEQRSLAGYSPWVTGSDTTERLTLSHFNPAFAPSFSGVSLGFSGLFVSCP